MENEPIIKSVNKALADLLRGRIPAFVPLPDEAESAELKQLCESVNALITTIGQAGLFMEFLSKGKLEVDPPPRNFLISPFKQLHANLRHLVWQTIQVSKGDLNQKVDFLGEFSEAFNSMIGSLREKRLMEDALRKAHSDLIEANTQILDGIHYARTIQTAFLPGESEMSRHMSDFFVIWRPRDIIGGDIYQFQPLKDGFLISLIDCTGHGVPGAIMTMIAGSCLTRALEEVDGHDPALILTKLNRLVKEALNQHHSETPSDDGLDIAICRVNKETACLTFAGAKIGLFVSTEKGVYEIAPDRQNIGYKSSDLNFAFTNHTVPLDPGTEFYMSTDGLIGQTGGSKGFSFGKKGFMNLLSTMKEKTFKEQRAMVKKALEDYSQGEPQLDDVTVIGFSG